VREPFPETRRDPDETAIPPEIDQWENRKVAFGVLESG
jgi:hypothetical protein